jgi:hypothetical protein
MFVAAVVAAAVVLAIFVFARCFTREPNRSFVALPLTPSSVRPMTFAISMNFILLTSRNSLSCEISASLHMPCARDGCGDEPAADTPFVDVDWEMSATGAATCFCCDELLLLTDAVDAAADDDEIGFAVACEAVLSISNGVAVGVGIYVVLETGVAPAPAVVNDSSLSLSRLAASTACA